MQVVTLNNWPVLYMACAIACQTGLGCTYETYTASGVSAKQCAAANRALAKLTPTALVTFANANTWCNLPEPVRNAWLRYAGMRSAEAVLGTVVTGSPKGY